MAQEYPDILGDLTDARQRWEVNGVQIHARCDPEVIPPSSPAELVILLQNALLAPCTLHIEIIPSYSEEKKEKQTSPPPILPVETSLDLELHPAEVGEIRVPMRGQPTAPEGNHRLGLRVQVDIQYQGMPPRIRSAEVAGRLEGIGLQPLEQLWIAPVTPLGYRCLSAEIIPVPLQINRAAQSATPSTEKPAFASLWEEQDFEWHQRAQREVNDRRVYVAPQLTPPKLFPVLLKSIQAAGQQAGLQLLLGESIFLTKMLTHTILHLTRQAEWLDVLLVPIYDIALRNELPTHDIFELLTTVGWERLIQISIARGFYLLNQALGTLPWSKEEQIAVRDFTAGALSTGNELPVEFLYIPLLTASLLIADQVVMPGEQIAQSIALLTKAWQTRASIFDDPDLAAAKQIFEQLLTQTRQAISSST